MNDVIINKTESIQRCIKRAREECKKAGKNFNEDYTRQDAAILNITRACEQTIDLANHLLKKKKLGIPDSSVKSFDLLAENRIITASLAESLKKMVGFRNIAVHEYTDININIVKVIIEEKLMDLLKFSEAMLPFAEE